MKRLISALLSLCIVAGAMPVVQRYAPESVITAHSSITGGGEIIDEYPEGELLFMVLSDYAIVRSNYNGNNENLPIAKGDIVIPSEYRGVPVIGIYGFENCTELKSITLPDTITKIADNTFLNCTSLETINIPESVNRVGYDAFEGTLWIENKRKESPLVIVNDVLVDGHKCEGEVVIPDNVTSIADRAFMNTEKVESISFPESVEYIGRQAFYNTGWLNKLSEENDLVIVNGFLLSGNNFGEDLVIPDTVKSINGHAINFNENLRTVTIPESVKHIGMAAVYCCPNLESVTILSPDCEIESYAAFSNVLGGEPTDVSFKGTIYGYEGSTAQTYAEKYGYKFEVIYDDKVKTDSEGNKYREVEDGDLLYWVYPDHAAVRSNYEITDNGEYIIKTSGDIVIPSEFRGVPVTGVFGFGGAQELTSITLPDTVTQIAANTFYNCRSLETINIPESVTFIGAEASGETPWIENKRNDSHLVIVNDILVECYNSEGEVIIPDNIRSIADYAFLSSENVDSVSIPDSVEYIGREAFRGTKFLDSITDENGFAIVNGFLLDGKKCKGDVAIPDTVRIISGEAFTLSDLTSVTIPGSVTTIGEYAFYNCPKLRSITILNPKCEIKGISAFDSAYDSEKTSYRGTVYGYAGSTAQAYAEKYGYKFEPVPGYSTLKGDANLDGRVNIADAVLVMQVATNPDKYAQGKSDVSITAQGEINADVDGKAGLTNSDALLIQKYKLGVIASFPDNNELLFGYNEGKPLVSQRIMLKCKASYELGETVKVDVAMGDEYAYHNGNGGSPDYNTAGHPEFGVYACDVSSYEKISDEKLLINGEESEYKQEFSKKEMRMLDISQKTSDYSAYYHTIADIDLSNYKAGDSGNILFYFNYVYDEENPDDPTTNISGMSRVIGFYVGEKGITIGAGAENAKGRYQAIFGS